MDKADCIFPDCQVGGAFLGTACEHSCEWEDAAKRAEVQSKIDEANAILQEAIDLHNPTHVFGLFSGGHDSLCATHLASKHPKFSGAVHINTTIGIEETRQFVRDTCRDHQWKLKEYFPPVSYRDIVLKHGLPGPGAHSFMYIRLKERCIRQLVKEHKVGKRNRIILVTGVRLQESERRMGHVVPIRREATKIWIAPILNWSSDDKLNYIDREGLKKNPVVEALCMSGECLCGAFAHPGEIAEIEAVSPATADVIHQLEAECAANGKHAKWGAAPIRPKKIKVSKKVLALCHSCEAKQADMFAMANKD